MRLLRTAPLAIFTAVCFTGGCFLADRQEVILAMLCFIMTFVLAAACVEFWRINTGVK